MEDRHYILPVRVDITDVEPGDHLDIAYDSVYSDNEQEAGGEVNSVMRSSKTGDTTSFELWTDDGERVLNVNGFHPDYDMPIYTSSNKTNRRRIGEVTSIWRIPDELRFG